MRQRACFIACVYVAFMPSPALAMDGDTQLWNSTNFNHKLDDKWSVNLELQERWYDDISHFQFFIVRPSASYKWNDWLTLTGGYGFFRQFPEEGSITDENRIWQQATIRLYKGSDKTTLNWRTRLEQRFFENVDEPTWRLREQLRLMTPFTKSAQGVIWTELLWRLNTTERGDAGLDQLACSPNPAPVISFESGYFQALEGRHGHGTERQVN